MSQPGGDKGHPHQRECNFSDAERALYEEIRDGLSSLTQAVAALDKGMARRDGIIEQHSNSLEELWTQHNSRADASAEMRTRVEVLQVRIDALEAAEKARRDTARQVATGLMLKAIPWVLGACAAAYAILK